MVKKERRFSVPKPPPTAAQLGIPNNRLPYMKSLRCDETVEMVHAKLTEAHVFKVPDEKPEEGWKATDFKEEVWQGNVKVLNRGDDFVGFILTEKYTDDILAVCPLDDVERCGDSSRYFIIKVQTVEEGVGPEYVAMAFNERGSAFDFNLALVTCLEHVNRIRPKPQPAEGEEETREPAEPVVMEEKAQDGTERAEEGADVDPSSSHFDDGATDPTQNVPKLKPHKNDKKKNRRLADIDEFGSSTMASTTYGTDDAVDELVEEADRCTPWHGYLCCCGE